MYEVKLFNKISKVGLERLEPEKYTCSEDCENYDAVLVRSAKLHETQFPETLKCIARAGASTISRWSGATREEDLHIQYAGCQCKCRERTGHLQPDDRFRDIAGDRMDERHWQGLRTLDQAAEKGKSKFAGPEISGKRLGVIRLEQSACRCRTQPWRWIWRYGDLDPYCFGDSSQTVPCCKSRCFHKFNEIFADCDYITLHLPVCTGSEHMIVEGHHRKDEGRCARGFVAWRAGKRMAAALESGKVARMCRIRIGNHVGTKNAVVMPHLGASTPESEDNCAKMAAKEIREFLEMGTIRNSVNFPIFKVPYKGGHGLCLIHRNVPNMIQNFRQRFRRRE